MYACNKFILQKEAILNLRSVQGFFQRNQQQKMGILQGERKGDKKHVPLR